jgi:hypothetical protein
MDNKRIFVASYRIRLEMIWLDNIRFAPSPYVKKLALHLDVVCVLLFPPLNTAQALTFQSYIQEVIMMIVPTN